MHDHINYRDILSSREHSQCVLTIAQVVLQHNHTTCKATKVVRVENRGVRGGGRAPLYACPPERLRAGTHGGGSFNITSACISLPQVRHSGAPRGGQ